MVNQLTFPRELRLLTPADFNHVFHQSIRLNSPYITFVAKKNMLPHSRVGFAIAKKQVKRAHDRNRLKRIVREHFRVRQHKLPSVDVIIMARTAAVELNNEALRQVLDQLWQRLISMQ